jgi:thioesterase domain-containing protein
MPGIAPVDDAAIVAAFAADLARSAGADGTGLSRSMQELASQVLDGEPVPLERINAGLAQDLGPERLRHMLDTFRAHCHALAAYTARPYPGRLTLIRAGGGPFAALGDSTLGWSALAQDVSTHVIPGDHYSLLQKPAVERVASVVQGALAHDELDR